MATKTQIAFNSLAELKLWFRLRNNDSIKLADIPEIISLRWAYFRDTWEFIREDTLSKANNYEFPDMLRLHIKNLTRFIDRQKNSQNKNVNPFSSNSIIADYYTVWDNIETSTIPLTRQEQNIIDDKTNRINRFLKTDFINIRKNLIAARDELADVIGLTDEDYNDTNNRSPVSQLRDVRISDIALMQVFMSGIRNVDFILANINFLDTSTVDPFALARANANNPDIEVADGKSSFLVRMNFGDSLQTLAQRYLGNPDRWVEIAIANGLKPPYVDEIGEAIPLIANGDDNQINIARLDPQGNENINKFFISQPVFLKSDTINFPEQREIINIKKIPISGEIVLELSGDIDLNKFKLSENAAVRVYLPNTVNSQFLVAIPSTQPLSQNSVGEVPFFMLTKSEDERRAGIDFALSEDADLIFTSYGDLQLSYGVSNALQAVKLKLASEKGQSPRHPNYGLPQVVGQKVRDAEALKATLVTGLQDLIGVDPRFDRIETLDVRQSEGNTITIGMVVRMAGTGTLLPINFNINTN